MIFCLLVCVCVCAFLLQFGCSRQMNEKVIKFRQPSVDILTESFCVNMLIEAKSFAAKGFSPVSNDLFMEQGKSVSPLCPFLFCVCGFVHCFPDLINDRKLQRLPIFTLSRNG